MTFSWMPLKFCRKYLCWDILGYIRTYWSSRNRLQIDFAGCSRMGKQGAVVLCLEKAGELKRAESGMGVLFVITGAIIMRLTALKAYSPNYLPPERLMSTVSRCWVRYPNVRDLQAFDKLDLLCVAFGITNVYYGSQFCGEHGYCILSQDMLVRTLDIDWFVCSVLFC